MVKISAKLTAHNPVALPYNMIASLCCRIACLSAVDPTFTPRRQATRPAPQSNGARRAPAPLDGADVACYFS
jgi:hypothetical protein